MTIRRCCCDETGETVCDQTKPEPTGDCTEPRWQISCFAVGMKGVQFYSGQVTFTDGGCWDCQKGECGVVALHQGSVDNPDAAAEGECYTTETEAEACQKYQDGKGVIPEYSGHDIVTFEDPFNIVEEDQSDVVYVTGFVRCAGFLGCQPTTDTRKFSTVTVEYTFSHTYNSWSLNPNGLGECVWTQVPVSVNQTWTCTYQRVLYSGEYIAHGTYYLVHLVAPWVPNIPTGCEGQCYTPSEYEFCAVTYRSLIYYQGLNLPWRPPGRLTVTRIC